MYVCVCVYPQHADELMPRKSRSQRPPSASGIWVSPVSTELARFRLAGLQLPGQFSCLNLPFRHQNAEIIDKHHPIRLFTWSPGIELNHQSFKASTLTD